MPDSVKSTPKVFVREATGLVRDATARSSFIAMWMITTGGYPIFLMTYLGTFMGANFFLALVLGFLPMFALLAVYSLFGISMPRAGGDYVYVSRGLNPFVGFVSAFALATAYMVSNGIYVVFGDTYLGYHLAALGLVDHNPGLLSAGTAISAPVNAFSIAILITAISVGIAIVQPKYAWRTVFWTGVIGVACTVIMFGILATINQGTFKAIYDSFIGTNTGFLNTNGYANATTYDQTLVAGGWTPPSSVLAATMLAFPIALYSYTWSMLPANWAGEMKQVKRNLPLILLGGMIWLAIYYILFMQLSINAFGQPFLSSWSAIAASPHNPSYALPATLSTYPPFFAYLVYHNPIVPWVMFLALFIPAIFSFPPLLIASVRYLFAFSFDRTLPERISSVNERTHTPIIATGIAAAVSIAGSAIQAFAPSATPSVIVPVFIFGYLMTPLAAIVFPYIKRQLYESSFVVKRKVAGVPVITWVGLVAFAGLAVGTYSIFASGIYIFNLTDYVFYALAYGLGVIIFVSAYAFRKRQGVELSLAFREIPPE